MRIALCALVLWAFASTARGDVDITFREPSTFANDNSAMTNLASCRVQIMTTARGILTSRIFTASSASGGVLRTVHIGLNPTETAQAQVLEIACFTKGGSKGLVYQELRSFPVMQAAEPTEVHVEDVL